MANTITPDESGMLTVGMMIDTDKGIAHIRDITTDGETHSLSVYYDAEPRVREWLTLTSGDIVTIIHEGSTDADDVVVWYDKCGDIVMWEEEVELD